MITNQPLTDEALLEGLANGTLDPANFSHEAHLRLAWIQLKLHDPQTAIDNVCELIQTYVGFVGAKDKFNMTLTVAAVKAVHHFMQKRLIDTFSEFISVYPRLKTNFKDLLDQHYGFDTFEDEAAKVEFLEPDLLPFD